MHPRQTITELFSTFLEWAEDCASGWLIDPKLRRSMDNCLKWLPEVKNSENFWALYWHKIWQTQSDSLAGEHLSAYLQEVCYWAAQKTITHLANCDFYHKISKKDNLCLTKGLV